MSDAPDAPDERTIFRPRRAAAESDGAASDVDDVTALSSRASHDAESLDLTLKSQRHMATEPEYDATMTRRGRANAAREDAGSSVRSAAMARPHRGGPITELPWEGSEGFASPRTASSPELGVLRRAGRHAAVPTISERSDAVVPRSRELSIDYAASLRADQTTARRSLAWIIGLSASVMLAAAAALVLLLPAALAS